MFRFTIRDVLWLMVVVGMGVGWWLEFKQRGPENVKLREDNKGLLENISNLESRISALEKAAKLQKLERDSTVIALAES